MVLDLTKTELTLAEIYQITTVDGIIARFTSHDQDIVYAGNTYQAIPITRTQVSYHTDLQVDKVDVSFGLVGVTVGDLSYSIPKIIRLGLLRGAHVVINLIDYVALDDDKLIFEGWVTGNITYNRGITTIPVSSLLDRLNEKFPKYIYSEYCNHKLYGTYCGLTKNTYREQSSAAAGSTVSKIYSAIFAFSAHAEDYWTKGEIEMTSGDNLNVSRTIIKHNDGNIDLLIPFTEAIAEGNTFDSWPGCDKSGEICESKFNNYANFMGFEHTPKPETLYG